MPKKKKTTTSTSNTPAKVFDVARPGKSAASATSRPVIVGHKPQVKDPMMSDHEQDRSLMDGKKKVSVAPAAGQDDMSAPELAAAKPDELDEKTPPEEVASVILGDTVVVDAPRTDVKVQEQATAPELPQQGESTPVQDAAASAPEAPEPQPAPIIEESSQMPEPARQVDAEQTPALPRNTPPAQGASQLPGTTGIIYEELPTAQGPKTPLDSAEEPLPVLPEEQAQSPKVQVVVSHHKPRKSGAAVFGWLVFVVLLAVVVLDILLDAGIITLEGVPHTHFF